MICFNLVVNINRWQVHVEMVSVCLPTFLPRYLLRGHSIFECRIPLCLPYAIMMPPNVLMMFANIENDSAIAAVADLISWVNIYFAICGYKQRIAGFQ